MSEVLLRNKAEPLKLSSSGVSTPSAIPIAIPVPEISLDRVEASKDLANLCSEYSRFVRLLAGKPDRMEHHLKLDLNLSLSSPLPGETKQGQTHRESLLKRFEKSKEEFLAKYEGVVDPKKVEELLKEQTNLKLVELYLSKTREKPWKERRQELLKAGVIDEKTESKYRILLYQKELGEVTTGILQSSYSIGFFQSLANKGNKEAQDRIKQPKSNREELRKQLEILKSDLPDNYPRSDSLRQELNNFNEQIFKTQRAGIQAFNELKAGEEQKRISAYQKQVEEGGALFATKQALLSARDSLPKVLETTQLVTIGNIAQGVGFVGGAVQGKNPFTSARDTGAAYVEGTRELFNKHAWGGSLYGTEEEFSKASLPSLGFNMHPLGHIGDAVVKPAFELLDIGRVEISRRGVVGDLFLPSSNNQVLSYSQYREAEQTDPLLKASRYSFQVAEIAGSLAVMRPESVAALGRMISLPVGMGVVGSAGQEFMTEGNFDWGRFAENTLSQTANSSMFMSGMSVFSKVFVNSQLGEIGAKLSRGEQLVASEVEVLKKLSTQAAVIRETIDAIDGLGDLSGSLSNFENVRSMRQGLGAILQFITAATDVGDVKFGLGGTQSKVIPQTQEKTLELSNLVIPPSPHSKYSKPVSEILDYKDSTKDVRESYVEARTKELLEEGKNQKEAELIAKEDSKTVVAFYNRAENKVIAVKPQTLIPGATPTRQERLRDAVVIMHELDHVREESGLSKEASELASFQKRREQLNKVGCDLEVLANGSWRVVEGVGKSEVSLEDFVKANYSQDRSYQLAAMRGEKEFKAVLARMVKDVKNGRKIAEIIESNNLTEPEEFKQFALALIKAGKGDHVAAHLTNFKGIDHNDIAKRLIENGESWAVASSLDNFKELDSEVALKLIAAGFYYEFCLNLRSFKRLNSKMALKLVKAGTVPIANHLSSFEGLDHNDIAFSLIEAKEYFQVAKHLPNFTGLDHNDIANRIMEDKHGHAVAEHLPNFEGLDHSDIAIRIIDAGQNWAVAKFLRNFKGLNSKVAVKLIEIGETRTVITNLKSFDISESSLPEVVNACLKHGNILQAVTIYRSVRGGDGISSDEIFLSKYSSEFIGEVVEFLDKVEATLGKIARHGKKAEYISAIDKYFTRLINGKSEEFAIRELEALSLFAGITYENLPLVLNSLEKINSSCVEFTRVASVCRYNNALTRIIRTLGEDKSIIGGHLEFIKGLIDKGQKDNLIGLVESLCKKFGKSSPEHVQAAFEILKTRSGVASWKESNWREFGAEIEDYYENVFGVLNSKLFELYKERKGDEAKVRELKSDLERELGSLGTGSFFGLSSEFVKKYNAGSI
jgi:hypothetical protein